jgi:hypothetical protein
LVNQTPLPKLAFIPAPGAPAPTDPIASLRATFFPDGTVKVTPWNNPAPQASASPTANPSPTVAASPSPEATASPSPSPAATTTAGSGQEIVEPAKLKELQPKLYDTIDAQWKTANFKEDLTFLVRVNGEGKILEYKPKGQAATDFAAETPMPQLGKANDTDSKPQEAYAAFKVVFTPEGKLQINPWAGYGEGQ